MHNPKAPQVRPLFKEELPLPNVILSLKAKATLDYCIASPSKGDMEISLYGSVTETDDGDVYISDFFIPFQECTSATSNPKDQNICMFEARKAGFDPASLKAWFHLHPESMEVQPSGTDTKQTDDYVADWGFLVRGIVNNIGHAQLDYYSHERGLEFNNLEMVIDYGDFLDAEDLEAKIAERLTKKVIPIYKPKNAIVPFNNPKKAQVPANLIINDPKTGEPLIVFVGQTARGLLYSDLAQIDLLGDEADVYTLESNPYVSTIINELNAGMFLEPKKTMWMFKKRIGMGKELFKEMMPSVATYLKV